MVVLVKNINFKKKYIMESFYYWFGFIAFWAILFFVLVYVVMTLFWFFYKAYQVKKFYKLMEDLDKDE